MNVDMEEVGGIEALLEPHVPLERWAPSAESDESGIEDRLARVQMVGALELAIRGLPERLQTVLGLHYLEGLTYREIAKILDVSEPRVCQLHADGLKRLRVAMPGAEG